MHISSRTVKNVNVKNLLISKSLWTYRNFHIRFFFINSAHMFICLIIWKWLFVVIVVGFFLAVAAVGHADDDAAAAAAKSALEYLQMPSRCYCSASFHLSSLWIFGFCWCFYYYYCFVVVIVVFQVLLLRHRLRQQVPSNHHSRK